MILNSGRFKYSYRFSLMSLSFLGLSLKVAAPITLSACSAREFTPFPFVNVNSSSSLYELKGRAAIYLSAISSDMYVIKLQYISLQFYQICT